MQSIHRTSSSTNQLALLTSPIALLERWLWDMVNTMVQKQQKSESFAAIHCTTSSALLLCCVAAGMGCEILRIYSRLISVASHAKGLRVISRIGLLWASDPSRSSTTVLCRISGDHIPQRFIINLQQPQHHGGKKERIHNLQLHAVCILILVHTGESEE
jgi:hypothetical protein